MDDDQSAFCQVCPVMADVGMRSLPRPPLAAAPAKNSWRSGHGEPYSPGPVISTSSRNARAASYAPSISVAV